MLKCYQYRHVISLHQSCASTPLPPSDLPSRWSRVLYWWGGWKIRTHSELGFLISIYIFFWDIQYLMVDEFVDRCGVKSDWWNWRTVMENFTGWWLQCLQWGIWWVCRQPISIQSQIKVANHPGKMDTPLKTNMEPETPVWKGESSSKPPFLGSMLVLGGV